MVEHNNSLATSHLSYKTKYVIMKAQFSDYMHTKIRSLLKVKNIQHFAIYTVVRIQITVQIS